MATLKPAQYFGLKNLGSITPGRSADIVIVNNLKQFKAKTVLIAGKIVAKDGEYMGGLKGVLTDAAVRRTVNLKEVQPEDLRIKCPRKGIKGKEKATARVIGIVEDQVITEELRYEMELCRGEAQPDPERDLLKILVAERHKGTGRIGKGFVKGFGLEHGAIASTVAHDSHNVIAVGTNDEDLCRAMNRLREIDGGFVIADRNRILDELPLPIAGLMTSLKASDIAQKVKELKETSAQLGCNLRDPFMTLSFLALPVIPKLKITDYGLVDAEELKVVDLFLE